MNAAIETHGLTKHYGDFPALKNLDLEFPRARLTVITGVSGSGKSSLAFDTIYAEGQRRYVESLSAYARQFLEQMERPDVESVSGLSPAVAIEQRTTVAHPRSTVGTVTEIYDHLRLLFSTLGRPHCPRCDHPIAPQSAEQIGERLMKKARGAVAVVAAPVARGRKGGYRKQLAAARQAGFLRARIDGEAASIVDFQGPGDPIVLILVMDTVGDLSRVDAARSHAAAAVSDCAAVGVELRAVPEPDVSAAKVVAQPVCDFDAHHRHLAGLSLPPRSGDGERGHRRVPEAPSPIPRAPDALRRKARGDHPGPGPGGVQRLRRDGRRHRLPEPRGHGGRAVCRSD